MKKLFFLTLLIHFSLCVGAQNDTLNFLKAGDKAPVFKTLNHGKTAIDLTGLLKKGKVVIVFYRGAWCPYCNKHMSSLQDSLGFILDKEATLIAISPEVDSSIEKTIAKSKASFNIVHDSTYTLMKKYGVAFQVNSAIVARYKLVGINLEEANGNKDNILPVPATFIINQDGVIDYIHFDENYKKRLAVKEIIKHL